MRKTIVMLGMCLTLAGCASTSTDDKDTSGISGSVHTETAAATAAGETAPESKPDHAEETPDESTFQI